ncbi:calycin-like domain-containing protein, partial [Bacteroides caecimuris]
MKKSLLYLFMLVCSVTLFTGCNNDDDTELTQVTDISGDYQGRLVVSIDGSAAEPISQLISIIKSGEQNSQVLLSLKDFSFAGQLVGDIEVPCTVVEKDGIQEFSGQKDLSFTTEFG